MRALTVLHDGGCEACLLARAWLERQPQLVPLELLPAASERARKRFPDLDPASTLADLTVVGDGGEVYRGVKAWVMCLWALREYREWALTLGSPALMPSARRFVTWISQRRHRWNRVLAPRGAGAP